MIFLDIETIPSQAPGAQQAAQDRIQAPANYKDPEKIKAYIEAKSEEAWLKTALNGTYGEVHTIGFAINESPVKTFTRENILTPESERELLESFWGTIAGADQASTMVWVGHNIQRFDLRFLWQRSVIHGVRPVPHFPVHDSPFSESTVDTMTLWTGSRTEFISLEDLARVVLGVEPSGIDGSEVWNAIVNAEYDAVVEHCKRDVELVRDIYNRLEFGG